MSLKLKTKEKLEKEIELFKKQIKERRVILKNMRRREREQIKREIEGKVKMKRGRKAGEKGYKCNIKRYKVEKIIENIDSKFIGNFCSFEEIAKNINLNKHQVGRIFRDEKKLNKEYIITKI